MSLIGNRSGPNKVRAANFAVFASFTLFLLAYIDLFLLLENRVFLGAPGEFWSAYRLTSIAFFALVVAVLASAVYLTFASTRHGADPGIDVRALLICIITSSCISIACWGLFFLLHGFYISLIALLSTLCILAAAVLIALQSQAPFDRVYRCATLPALLTTLLMAANVVLTGISYSVLNRVAPDFYRQQAFELTVVIALMIFAVLVAAGFVVRACLER